MDVMYSVEGLIDGEESTVEPEICRWNCTRNFLPMEFDLEGDAVREEFGAEIAISSTPVFLIRAVPDSF